MLALNVSGDLPAGQARRLNEHLHGCPGCRRFEARLREGRRELSALAAAEETPAPVRAAVLERIADEPSPSVFPGWKLAGAAAAALLVLALILVQFFPGSAPAPLSTDSGATGGEPPVETASVAGGDTAEKSAGAVPLPPTGEPATADTAPPTVEPAVAEAAAEAAPARPVTPQRPERPTMSEPDRPLPTAETVVVKMLTDDPDVVIYMLVDEEEGDPRDA
jgi:anti-sigma factor RsiW